MGAREAKEPQCQLAPVKARPQVLEHDAGIAAAHHPRTSKAGVVSPCQQLPFSRSIVREQLAPRLACEAMHEAIVVVE